MLAINLTTLGELITDKQQDAALSLAAWIVLGAITGLAVNKLLNRDGLRLFRYVLLGIIGAIIGGFLSNLLGKSAAVGVDLYSLMVAIVAAAVFLIVYHALFRRKRFLSMR